MALQLQAGGHGSHHHPSQKRGVFAERGAARLTPICEESVSKACKKKIIVAANPQTMATVPWPRALNDLHQRSAGDPIAALVEQKGRVRLHRPRFSRQPEIRLPVLELAHRLGGGWTRKSEQPSSRRQWRRVR